ncbi:hypothetical protein LUZ60_002111 [Juncus effusus]|nr:hypothetical protein LUZ60_002111 [Juncus effusus]
MGETHGSSDSSSSGSQHEAATCLSRLVQSFLESNTNDEPSNHKQDLVRDESDNETDSELSYSNRAAELKSLLDPSYQIDPFRIRLASDVKSAIESERAKLSEKPSLFRRAVASRLSKMGYDSGICKSSWKASNGLTAGSYEYIDVVVKNDRYIVDSEFASAMEVARATDEYHRIMTAVPNVVVAKVESVGRAVRIVSELARRSLREKGMHVPPWRKTRYMLAKWLGPYKRTCTASLPIQVSIPHEVTCRTAPVMGFQIIQTGRTR